MSEKDYEQQILEWRFRQIQFRKKYRNTPAGFQNLEEEMNEIKIWEEDMNRFRSGKIYKIQSLYHPEKHPFVGRQQELDRIEKTLHDNHNTAIIYGIGGIGKTALVQEYLYRFQDKYDGIIYFTLSKTIKNTVCNDTMLNISNLKYHPDKYENLTKYYKIKMQLLQEILEKGKYILVLDDCNVEIDHDLNDFLNLSADKLITTRVNPDAWGYPGIEVCSFKEKHEWDEFITLYMKKPLGEKEKEEILDYIHTIQGHTLAVMLKISNRNAELDKDMLGHSLLQSFPLKKREKDILMYLSILPKQGIPYSMFKTISELKEGELKRLREFLLIQIEQTSLEIGDRVSLHPLIAEVVRKEYVANPINCRSLLRGLVKYINGENPQRKELWENSYENNRKIEEVVFAFTNTFTDPVPWMAETFDCLSTFLWVQGYFDEAEAYSLKIYECVKDYYGEFHQLTGWMALRMGAVYYNKMDRHTANIWYLKGLEILKKCKPANQDYYVYLMEAMAIAARMYRHKEEYDSALNYIDQALNCFDQFKKKQNKMLKNLSYIQCLKLPYYLISKTGILLEMGRINEAEELYNEALNNFNDISSDEFRKNTFRNMHVEILIRKNAYKEAEKYAVENLKFSQLYRGKSYKDTLMYMEKLADIQRALGKETEASSLYQQVLLSLRKDYPNQQKWIEKLGFKLNC